MPYHSTKQVFIVFFVLSFLFIILPKTGKAQDFTNLRGQKDSLFQIIKKRELQLSDSITIYHYKTKRNKKMVVSKGFDKQGRKVKLEKTLYTRKGNIRRIVKYKTFTYYAVVNRLNILNLYCKTFNQNIIKATFFDEKGVLFVIYNNTAIPIEKLNKYQVAKLRGK